MASESSFDIVSEFDHQELVNAIDIALREITNRFDLKGTNSKIELEEDKIKLTSSDDYKVKALYDILQSKAVKRGLSLKIFDPQKIESALGGTAKQEILLKQGLNAEQAKEINKKIREQYPKVRVQIQGDAVRVFAKARDELQAVIGFLKQLDYKMPLQFTNYR